MYHSVLPRRPDLGQWTVSLERFEQQMRWLARRGRRGVTMAELIAADPAARKHLVGLTFDDGYADFAEYVLPVLRRHGFGATAFIVAGRIGGDTTWLKSDRQRLLTAEHVRQVAAAGIEVGSHGMSHESLVTTSDADLATEVSASRETLRRVSGQDVPGIAYPYGHHDSRVVSAARAAGYGYACAVGYSEHTGIMALPRIYIGDRDSPARLWAKGLRRWLRWEYSGPGARHLEATSNLLRRTRSRD
jgi:peptidoglycan/xylan/chitin deacetylase (PgdA/CDA1 family)